MCCAKLQTRVTCEHSTSILAAGWRTFILERIVAPSLEMRTSPEGSCMSLSMPRGPRDVRMAAATAWMWNIRIWTESWAQKPRKDKQCDGNIVLLLQLPSHCLTPQIRHWLKIKRKTPMAPWARAIVLAARILQQLLIALPPWVFAINWTRSQAAAESRIAKEESKLLSHLCRHDIRNSNILPFTTFLERLAIRWTGTHPGL